MLNPIARSIATASLSATLLFAANPLAAAQTQRIAVHSSDLNLTKGADRATLQQRIAHTVDRVCGLDHARTTADVQAYATCSKAAQASAATQFDAMVAKAQTGTKMASDGKTTTSAQ
jgi:UrcA family protein